MIRCAKAATVTVDGKIVGSIGADAFSRIEVAAGQHVVNITASDGSGKWEGEVRVPIGEQVLLTPTLTPTDPKEGIVGFYSDPTGATYKTTKIGHIEWFAENFRRAFAASRPPAGNEANSSKYGRLYYLSSARSLAPAGWRLPSKADWQSLLATYEFDDTYGELTKGGRSNMDLVLAGGYEGSSASPIEVSGSWWASTMRDSKYSDTAYIVAAKRTALIGYAVPLDYQRYSIRYCRDV